MKFSTLFPVFLLACAVFFPMSLSAREVIPTVKTIPVLSGKFVEEEWAKDSLKLASFTMIPRPGTPQVTPPARERTIVYLKRDKESLYMALILLNEDVLSLMKTQKKDRKRPAWALNGIEIFLGETSFLQLAFDYMGRLYKNSQVVCYTNVMHKKDRIILRVGIPLKDIPRCSVSPELTRLALYRKSNSGVSSAYPTFRSNFKDMSLGRPLLLSSGKLLADSMSRRSTHEIEKLYKANSLTGEDRASLLAELMKKKKALLSSMGNEKKLFAALKDFNTMDGAIAKAQEKCLRSQFGIRKKGKIFAEKPYTALPSLWRPQKIFGKDFWYTFTAFPNAIKTMEYYGLMKDPLFSEAMFFLRWGQIANYNLLDPKSDIALLLKKYPDTPFAIKTPCPKYIPEKLRKSPNFKAFWDKEFIEKFYQIYGKRFSGFWSDEAFVSGTSNFAQSMDHYKIPRPKTREEAYRIFRQFYFKKADSPPYHVPFRNVANMSRYTYKDAMNCAAVQLNHMVHAFGDKMSGNETGDVMGPMASKLAFARGAARQYSRPWRNYNTYYSWYFLNEVAGGGRCTTMRGGLWGERNNTTSLCLHEGCRWRAYGHLDGPLCGITPDRQKPFIIYPYIAGATVWYSEADLQEMTAVYKPNEKVDPLVRNLRNLKVYKSEVAKIHSHFYNNIVKKRDRGVMLTPVALIYDRAHGYLPLYFGETVWDLLIPTEMEKTMWAIDRHLFKSLPHNPSYTSCRYGDIFDVLTNDSPEKILATYKVLYPVGDVTLDKKFAAKLKNYVKKGGTLILNAALLKKYSNAFDEAFPGAKVTGKEAKSFATYSRIHGKVIPEEFPFTYLEMIPSPGTEILAYTADVAKKPAVTRKKFGRGYVILTSPLHMKVEKSLHKMLNLFDHLMEIVKKETIPIEVKTTMQYAFCRNKNGYVIYMQNNEKMPPSGGIYYGKEYPREYLKVKSKAEIFFPSSLGKVKEIIDWWTGKKVAFRNVKGGISLTSVIRGGECRMLEFIIE